MIALVMSLFKRVHSRPLPMFASTLGTPPMVHTLPIQEIMVCTLPRSCVHISELQCTWTGCQVWTHPGEAHTGQIAPRVHHGAWDRCILTRSASTPWSVASCMHHAPSVPRCMFGAPTVCPRCENANRENVNVNNIAVSNQN